MRRPRSRDADDAVDTMELHLTGLSATLRALSHAAKQLRRDGGVDDAAASRFLRAVGSAERLRRDFDAVCALADDAPAFEEDDCDGGEDAKEETLVERLKPVLLRADAEDAEDDGAPLRQRRLSSVDEEQRRFAGRVREAFGQRTGATKASDVEALMTALGRTAPKRLVDHALSALGFDERQSLDEQAVVDLCLIIEKRRARAVVDRCKRHSADLMHVSGNDDFMFDLFIMVILLYVFVSLPLCLAFDRINARLKWVNLACDCCFMIDIAKNLNTGFVDEHGTIIMERRQVFYNYLKTWLVIDLSSSIQRSIPITEILEIAGSSGSGSSYLRSTKSLRMLRLIRMTKLLKLLRASQLVNKVRNLWIETLEYYRVHVSDSSVKLLRLFAMMLTLSHWGSCLMFILLKSYNYPRQAWAVRWKLVRHDSGVPLVSVAHCYSWGIYKSLLLVVGTAFQEFPSAQICYDTQGWCLVESWMTLAGLFLGCFFNAAVVSTITAIIVNSNVSTQEFEEQLLRTNEYMRSLHLPTELRDRIREYYFHRWSEGKIFDETLILERLNPELCTEILFYKIRELVPKVPLLRTSGKRFPELLAASMEPQVFVAGDIVVTEGETGNTMYFIDKGVVKRTATIRCKHIMSVYGVDGDTVQVALSDYPDVGAYLERVARKRIARLDALRVNSAMEPGAPGLDEDDDEDMRTPLFQSIANRATALDPDRGLGGMIRRTTQVLKGAGAKKVDAYAPDASDFKTAPDG
ncbi:voltage-gated potassium channel [Aureococcus anophagefferens]|nr:voltage-gated potassium channel [Aureococcus anophagefferens]